MVAWRRYVIGVVGLATLPLGPLGCTRPDPKAGGPPPTFEDRLLEIARTYEEYGRFPGLPHLAPVYCRAPPDPLPRFSAQGDSSAHGRKLYWLFVKEVPAGAAGGTYFVAGKPSPVGQVIVKQAWLPEEVSGEKAAGRRDCCTHQGRVYRASRKAGLFVLFKVDPQTPGTDEGWVYGTVTADGKEVTSAGRVESCMNCHQRAPHDRLFGLPKD
jgi:hypothetical protein